MILSAIALAGGCLANTGPAAAQYRYSVGISDTSQGGLVVVQHTSSCSHCTRSVRTWRAGEFSYEVPQAPSVDFGMVLPIYQPPLTPFPPQVVPAYPVYPRSGGYPVTSPFQQQAMMPMRPFYPTGSGARVIRIGEPRPVQRPRARVVPAPAPAPAPAPTPAPAPAR